MHIVSRCSPNQNVKSNVWIQWLHWAEECCINLVSSPYHQYGVEIYLRLSPARSLDYYFVTPVTFHKSRTCKTDTPVYPFPVLTNPHELSWPPSTLDGWECCLLSMLPFKQNHCGWFFIQIAICYLRYYTRQFFPTTVVVRAALVAFALQQLNNNSLDQT